MWEEYDHNEKIPEPGWYAIHYCWDPEEGSWCSCEYWNGEEWAESWPISLYNPKPFLSEEEAMAWVTENDNSY